MLIGETNLNAREASIGAAPTHSETLLPMIDNLFKLCGLSPGDADYIACASGPGSFTGLRIGAATAMGMARGLGKPLIPVPTLNSLAYNVECGASGLGALIVPVMDARRGQVYSAFYEFDNGRPVRLTDYLAEDINEITTRLSEDKYARRADGRVFFVGDGADAYRDVITRNVPGAVFAPPVLNRQRAASTGVAALHVIEDGFTPSAKSDFELLYVRKPQAVREKEAGRKAKADD